MSGLLDRLADLGVTLRDAREGTHRVPCPECDRGPRDTALAVTLAEARAVWMCHRCGFKGAARERRESHIMPPPTGREGRVEQARHTTLAAHWREFWRACSPVSPDSVVGRYLVGRGCRLPPRDGHLRWHAAAWHWPTQQRHPAMVALITDVATGTPLSLHFTFLKPDGRGKADLERPKLLLPKHRKAGGVIRLWPDTAVTAGVLIAEGIETTLTAARAYTPCWCCIDAGNLAAFPVLAGIDSLLIAVDRDAAGLKAAQACAQRWADAGRGVGLVEPSIDGADLNDEFGVTA